MSNVSKKILTLCFIADNEKILLGMKKRGFGEGRWNGFGGKVEQGETIEEAARREFLEEANIKVLSLSKKGELLFEFVGEQEILEVHIFLADKYKGEAIETEEMAPKWFIHHEIPYDDMWPDDIYWLPLFLEGKCFEGKFVFSDQNTIIEKSLRVI